MREESGWDELCKLDEQINFSTKVNVSDQVTEWSTELASLQHRTQAHFIDVKRPWLWLVTCEAVKNIPQRGWVPEQFFLSSRLTLLTLKVCLEILVLKRDLLSVLPTDYNKSLLHQILTWLVRERDQSPSTVVTTDLLFRSEGESEPESSCLWCKENVWSR